MSRRSFSLSHEAFREKRLGERMVLLATRDEFGTWPVVSIVVVATHQGLGVNTKDTTAISAVSHAPHRFADVL
jgi:hypothetical protein